MNKRLVVSLIVLVIGFALVVSHYAVAQPAPASVPAGDRAMQRLVRLVSSLNARGETNTLAQVTSLLAAKDALVQTRDATTSIALLEALRAGKTNEVIAVLEITLDSAVSRLRDSPQEVGAAQSRALELAEKYRAKYPRK